MLAPVPSLQKGGERTYNNEIQILWMVRKRIESKAVTFVAAFIFKQDTQDLHHNLL